MIGHILKKWLPFFEIQVGGDCFLGFLQLCISDVIGMFQVEVQMFSIIVVKMGHILKKWQQFSKLMMSAAVILNCGYLDISTSPMCFKLK